MNSIVSQVIVVFISVVFGGLFTFFVTSLTQRKVFKSIAEELNIYHEKVHHKIPVETQMKDFQAVFEKRIVVHEEKCIAANDIGKLKTGVIWLVSQSGGNPADLGLN